MIDLLRYSTFQSLFSDYYQNNEHWVIIQSQKIINLFYVFFFTV
jgi:hypothetical protein